MKLTDATWGPETSVTRGSAFITSTASCSRLRPQDSRKRRSSASLAGRGTTGMRPSCRVRPIMDTNASGSVRAAPEVKMRPGGNSARCSGCVAGRDAAADGGDDAAGAAGWAAWADGGGTEGQASAAGGAGSGASTAAAGDGGVSTGATGPPCAAGGDGVAGPGGAFAEGAGAGCCAVASIPPRRRRARWSVEPSRRPHPARVAVSSSCLPA